MFNNLLKENCCPTLLGLKVANMFSYSYISKHNLFKRILFWNGLLNQKGIYITILNITDKKALIYIYRKEILINILNKKEVDNFLYDYGYKTNSSVEDYLSTLMSRIKSSKKFPHEIGVFLGYPLYDVICFIKNKGKNSICCGCWRVYCNKDKALKKFDIFKKCKIISERINKSDINSIVKLVDNVELLKVFN